jgi:N-acetylmuramoyl-L-alanine amidase
MADPITAVCRRDYYPAAHTSGARALSEIRWIVMHVTESDSASGSAHWFQNPDSGGSTHLVVDNDACYRCLPNDAVPWGAKGANRRGFHIEQAGWARRWPREKWLTEKDATIRRAAYKAAVHARLFDIPIVYRTAADLRAGRPGITVHYECVAAFGGDHTCPGRYWPRDVFMTCVAQYDRQLERLLIHA